MTSARGESKTALAEATKRERLFIHIAHENDDGSDPTRFLCGQPIRVLLPGPVRYAGDDLKSECAICNRLDDEYADA